MNNLRNIFRKDRERPIIGFSVYDYFGVKIVSEFEDIDFILIGDSLSMVFKGFKDVRHVNFQEMIYHLKIVSRNVSDKPIIFDMPLNSYEKPELALKNAETAYSEGADGVLIEGLFKDTMYVLKENNIEYLVHLGYKPKFDERPKVFTDFNLLYKECIEAYEAGALAVKLELVKYDIAKMIREKIDIPVLGVGSGPYVDGHILVLYDFIGMYPGFRPKFVRKYVDLYNLAKEAVEKLISDIKKGEYPSLEESY